MSGGAGGLGAGIFCNNAAGIQINNCQFINNQARGGDGSNAPSSPGGSGAGGGLCAITSTLSLTDCLFQSNQAIGGDQSLGLAPGAGSGGACYFQGGTPILSRCSFSSNIASGPSPGALPTASGDGGAIYFASAVANASLTDCTIGPGNKAATNATGGAVIDGPCGRHTPSASHAASSTITSVAMAPWATAAVSWPEQAR